MCGVVARATTPRGDGGRVSSNTVEYARARFLLPVVNTLTGLSLV